MRTDARRNRQLILDAARVLVADTGSEVTMEGIAVRAGVAVGTLYRHFPSKEDLVTAVVEDSIEQIAVLAERAVAAVASGAAPGEEFVTLFRAVTDRQVVDRTVKAVAGRLDAHADLVEASPDSPAGRATIAIRTVLDQAKAAGAVRADVGLAELVMLVTAAPGLEVPTAMRHRYVEVVLAGLAPPRRD